MPEYQVVIRFTELVPTEDFQSFTVRAKDEQEARRRALTEFWERKDPTPQPIVEIEKVTVTSSEKEPGNGKQKLVPVVSAWKNATSC